MEPDTATQSGPHVYAPLEDAESFRMRLEPALRADTPLHISFHVHLPHLDENHEAISYTWGEATLIYPVYLADGSHILVTRNLDSALRRFRNAIEPRVLWADAICINQIDDGEKALHIPLMTRISRGAHKVLAWLGSDLEEEK